MTVVDDARVQRQYDELISRSRIAEAAEFAVIVGGGSTSDKSQLSMATEYALDLAIRRKVFPADMRPVLDQIYRVGGYLL